jgi:5-methylcytosine-specific restriction endonuclease McrA
MTTFDRQYQLQGGRCFWHGAIVPIELMTRDHIYPRKNGQRWTHGNGYVLACEPCNRARGALTIGSWRFLKWLKRVQRGDIRRFTRRDYQTRTI